MWVTPALRFSFRAVGHNETKGMSEMDEEHKAWRRCSKSLLHNTLVTIYSLKEIEMEIGASLKEISIMRRNLERITKLPKRLEKAARSVERSPN